VSVLLVIICNFSPIGAAPTSEIITSSQSPGFCDIVETELTLDCEGSVLGLQDFWVENLLGQFRLLDSDGYGNLDNMEAHGQYVVKR